MAEMAFIACAVMSFIAGITDVMDLIACDEFIAPTWASTPSRSSSGGGPTARASRHVGDRGAHHLLRGVVLGGRHIPTRLHGAHGGVLGVARVVEATAAAALFVALPVVAPCAPAALARWCARCICLVVVPGRRLVVDARHVTWDAARRGQP